MNNSTKPLVSLLLPAFNEAAILVENLEILGDYVETLRDQFDWELIIVNDGSTDGTGVLAERFAETRPDVQVVHHPTNFGLGQAFKTGFNRSIGDYVVILDVDLSYAPEHIARLLTKIRETRAKVVLASPYMRGGQLSEVPVLRRILSIGANRFLSLFAQGNFSTLTCMVRAYDGPFIRALNIRSTGMEVMPEIVYKTMVLRGRIDQIPAHLDWSRQVRERVGRKSSMRIAAHIIATLLSGFIFRPFMFFIAPGLVLLAFALYVNIRMVMHFFDALASNPVGPGTDIISNAIWQAYQNFPHTFIVGLLSLMLAIQLLSLGILALQNKAYFEEIFHLGTAIARSSEATDIRDHARRRR